MKDHWTGAIDKETYYKDKTKHAQSLFKIQFLVNKLRYAATGGYRKRTDMTCLPNICGNHIDRDCCPSGDFIDWPSHEKFRTNLDCDNKGVHNCLVCGERWLLIGVYGYWRECCWNNGR